MSSTNNNNSSNPVRDPSRPYIWTNEDGIHIIEPPQDDEKRDAQLHAMFPSTYIFSKGKSRSTQVKMDAPYIDDRNNRTILVGAVFRWSSSSFSLESAMDMKDILKTATEFGNRIEENLKREHALAVGELLKPATVEPAKPSKPSKPESADADTEKKEGSPSKKAKK
jgi:hypothetical protein